MLLDVMMPEMDGFELCRVIREEQQRFVPIILVTALGETEHKVRGLDTGADDFITKPSNAAELRARVRANLRTKRLHDELESASREVEKLSHLKDLLTDMIVHDLRNPLGSLSLALQLMGDPPNPGNVDPCTWELTRQQIDSALEMCQQLLDIRKLQRGELTIGHAEFDLAEAVERAVAPLRLLARERAVGLRLAVPAISCRGDATLFKRVIMNLVNNAVKFSPNDSEVEVTAEADKHEIRVTVSDHGPGIPRDRHEFIFELFATTHTDAEAKGYGIGLAFCKLAVDAMGGRITVDSAPGEGSRFTVALPQPGR
jgi:signal transduction histidine kinase